MIDAATMEPLFDAFLEYAYGARSGERAGRQTAAANPWRACLEAARLTGRRMVQCVDDAGVSRLCLTDSLPQTPYLPPSGGSKAHTWHHSNPIFVINPNKVRPAGGC